MVIPISQASREYANSVRKAIRGRHFFVDVDHGDNKMEKKIRDAQLEQYNYILVSFPSGPSRPEVGAATTTFLPHRSARVNSCLSQSTRQCACSRIDFSFVVQPAC